MMGACFLGPLSKVDGVGAVDVEGAVVDEVDGAIVDVDGEDWPVGGG